MFHKPLLLMIYLIWQCWLLEQHCAMQSCNKNKHLPRREESILHRVYPHPQQSWENCTLGLGANLIDKSIIVAVFQLLHESLDFIQSNTNKIKMMNRCDNIWRTVLMFYNRAVRIFGSPKIYEIMSYLKWNNGSPVTYSRYKLSGCTYVRYGKTADSLSHNLIWHTWSWMP